MHCGYFMYKEYIKPYTAQYTCSYFGTIAGTKKHLCQDCEIDNSGTPHLNSIKKWDCPEDCSKCYWHRKGEPCEDCEYIQEDEEE